MDEHCEIRELEIFDAAEFPDYDVEQIAANFEAVPQQTGDDVQPPLVIGHSEDQTILTDSGLPAAGWISSLRAVGTKLVATVRDVPRLVAEAIGRRAYKRVSAEIYTDYKGLGQALRRVALLGGAIPKVKTLQDVIALYSDDEPFETLVTAADSGQPTAESEQPAAEGEVDEFADDGGEPVAEEPETADAPAPDAPTDDPARRREIERFCEDLKREGHYAPAWDELGLPEFLMGLDAERVVCFAEGAAEQTPLDWFRGFLRSLPAVVRFGEKAMAQAEPNERGRKPLVDFYRRNRSQFEQLGVTLEMFLNSEGC